MKVRSSVAVRDFAFKLKSTLKIRKDKDIRSLLKSWGFERKENSYHQEFFRNSSLVVKINRCIDLNPDYLPKAMVPTTEFQHGRHHVVVQERVKTDPASKLKAFKYFKDKHYTVKGRDAHIDNVGILKQKFVVFDW